MVPEVQKPVLEQTSTKQTGYGGSISIAISPDASCVIVIVNRAR
jgi:hypothetical protein